MARQYTQCYHHTPGDKPFSKADLLGFVAGNAWPGGTVAILAFLGGAPVVSIIAIFIQSAVTVTAVANAWLFHRLVCMPADSLPCAIGTVMANPTVGDLGEFDNDQYFSIRLMPHPPLSESASDQDKRDFTNAVITDGFQGTELLAPVAWDLPYADPVVTEERYYLHCEAEGNFWQAMKDYAVVAGLAVAGGAAVGAAGGAAAGCEIGGWFGPIGCAIGAIVGAVVGAFAGAAAAGYLVATVAFHSDPGNVQDANVGDNNPDPIKEGDRVLVHGHHVYDGFHEGWHELHPLLAVMKIPDYLEQNPAVMPYDPSLTRADILKGLSSPAFAASATALRKKWCERFQLPLDTGVHILQQQPQNRWTIHPAVDGCQPAPAPPR
ncbi:MAG: hypothetical protein ABI442_07665 [Gemmatimonadaceae bacterium]